VRTTKIVVLGGGIGGTHVALELERLLKRRTDVEVTLVSRDDFCTMTPLLFDAVSHGEIRHVTAPIQPLLARTRFVRAEIERVDLIRRVVFTRSDGIVQALAYDHLVVALGSVPFYERVPGSRENALPFKDVEDALALRSRVIDAFERASIERDPRRREQILRFVVVGGGLVGVELAGELSHFLERLASVYPDVRREEISLHLVESASRLLPDVDPAIARRVEKSIAGRGMHVRAGSPVEAITPGEVHFEGGESLAAGTIVYASGLAVSPVVASLAVEHDARGRIVTDRAMRSASERRVWALGDNAAIPTPDAPWRTYAPLAELALREAEVLARNLVRATEGESPEPIVHPSRGTLVLLGDRKAVGQFLGLRVRGSLAWFCRRAFYLVHVTRWQRRLRVALDWTLDLLLPADPAPLRVPARQAQNDPRSRDGRAPPSTPRSRAQRISMRSASRAAVLLATAAPRGGGYLARSLERRQEKKETSS
jgi:NADH dehydrogenase